MGKVQRRSTRLKRFLARRWSDNLFLLRCWMMLAVTTTALRFIHYRKCRHIFSHDLAPTHWSPESIGWAVTTAARYVPGAKCLAQAIIAETLLLQSGFPAHIQVGVTKPGESRLRAHAWVECEGVVVVGEEEREKEYAQIAAFKKV